MTVVALGLEPPQHLMEAHGPDQIALQFRIVGSADFDLYWIRDCHGSDGSNYQFNKRLLADALMSSWGQYTSPSCR